VEAQIIGISGSPIRNSNTDQAVQAVLAAAELPSAFIKLSERELQPCRACLGCVKDNRCVVKDDGPDLAEQFRRARAFVLGGFTPYSSLDARTKMFMERMYCLRHQTGLNAGKIGCSVLTTAIPPGTEGLPPALETTTAQINFWMMEEGMENLGTLALLGNVPCIKCGHGDECELSGIKMLFGPDATTDSVGVHKFTQVAALQQQAAELGKRLRAAVLAAGEGVTADS